MWPHYEAYEPGAYTRILSCLTTEPVAPEGELPYMCDACTKGDGGTCRCYPAPEGQQEAVAQFLPTEGGEYNGNVSDIIPDSCTSSSLVFSEGILHVTKDGSGHIVVKEDDFQIETEYDDDGARSDFWITRFPSGEMQSLKDFLNGVTFTRPAEQAVTVQQAAKVIYDAFRSASDLPAEVYQHAGSGNFFTALRLLSEGTATLEQKT